MQTDRCNIVGQQHVTLLGSPCCVRLHGTPTMLALVAYSLKPVKLLRPRETDVTSHNIVSPAMLGVVGTCCVVHANERNNCQHCWRLSKVTMHSGIVIVKKDCNAHAQTFSREQHCCGSMQKDASLLYDGRYGQNTKTKLPTQKQNTKAKHTTQKQNPQHKNKSHNTKTKPTTPKQISATQKQNPQHKNKTHNTKTKPTAQKQISQHKNIPQHQNKSRQHRNKITTQKQNLQHKRNLSRQKQISQHKNKSRQHKKQNSQHKTHSTKTMNEFA